ncbi:TonB-dependent receptor plug domain-containing protein [Breznakiella homolactica]|uniref:TonB-dependent receptor n=1 Tax=Breznakiella homolactica TaxID=2798577 RepID=A0A7T8B9Z6_9SPIR|nr:TonB-dependent receptor [Breznakiella homolactica]QQO10144.1 TonB-dependent receptor [Breznakiella homolactica]
MKIFRGPAAAPPARILFLAGMLFLFCAGFSLRADTIDEDDFCDEYPFVMEGEGLTFTAPSIPETTQQIKTVTKEEIEKAHAPDLAALLEQTLNLPVTRYGAYGNAASINMRGFGSGRVAILIDGVPVNSPQSGEFEISMIDVNSIEKIEVVYGGSDTKFNVSGAVGGIINIITVKEQKPGLRIGGSISNTSALPGTYNARGGIEKKPAYQDLADAQKLSVFAGQGLRDFSWSANLFANRAANHFLFEDYYGVTRRRENNEVYDTGANASFAWTLPQDSKLILTGDAYYGDKNIPGPGTSQNVGKQKDFSTRQGIMLDMPFAVSGKFGTETAVNHNWTILDYEDAGSDSLHDMHTVTAVNRWAWYIIPQVTLNVGGDYRFSYLDSTNIGGRTRHDGGIYLTAEFLPHKKVLIVPSVKMVLSENTAVPVPKLGFVWHGSDSFSLKNNYYRSYKLPAFNDLYWSGDATAQGNPDLRPEDGIGADITAEYRRKNFLTAQGTLYTTWMRDSIHWRNSDGVWKPVNVGEAAYFGLDTSVDAAFPFLNTSKNLVLKLSYNFLLTYVLTGELSFSSDIRMPYQPMHTFGVSLEIPWKSGSCIVSGHFESTRYTETQNIIKLDPFFILNLTVNQRIGKNVTVFAALKNALNTSYVTVVDYPMPGIRLTLGAKAMFDL